MVLYIIPPIDISLSLYIFNVCSISSEFVGTHTEVLFDSLGFHELPTLNVKDFQTF
jgi:hypothetical protein